MHHRWANHRIVRAYITKMAGVYCYGGVSFGHGVKCNTLPYPLPYIQPHILPSTKWIHFGDLLKEISTTLQTNTRKHAIQIFTRTSDDGRRRNRVRRDELLAWRASRGYYECAFEHNARGLPKLRCLCPRPVCETHSDVCLAEDNASIDGTRRIGAICFNMQVL